MSKVARYLLLLGIILLGLDASAQRLGTLPSKVKWYQLKEDSFRILFPEGQQETAKRVASLMLKLAVNDPITYEGRFKPISILLQPQTNISNGYVGLAPYVSEFYLQPSENPMDLGSLSWADLLAIHEWRHVQQMNAANTGISHLVKLVFGELLFAGAYDLSVSNWLREGDAVYAETKWTMQGRGRLSSFSLPFREKLKEGKPWKYYVLRNGSYRTFMPDHYPLGYHMVQYGNHVFGEATWDTIFRTAPRFVHLFDPLSGVIKDFYGKKNRLLYADAFNWFREKWKSEEVEDVDYPMIPLKDQDLSNNYFDMTYPSVDGQGSIYTAITTFDKTTAIYKIGPAGERKKVASMGLQQDTYFDWSNNRLVWTELRFDPRWIRKDKNVIVVFDLAKRQKIDIEPEKGFYMPSLDETGNRIVTLHTGTEGNYNILILDAKSGRVLNTLPNNENLYLGYPCFTADGHNIIATARNQEGRMCLVEQNIESGTIRMITHYSYSVLGKPVINEPWIYVTAGLGTLDQVFAVDKNEGIFYQVGDGNRAHYDPAWDPVQENIICSEYRLNGKKLVRLPGLPMQWKLINLDSGIKNVVGITNTNLLAEAPVKESFEIKKYSPWSNAFNVHSWIITADDPLWGLELRSDNVMSNINMAAGYNYNRNNKSAGPYFNMRLGMWFPVLNFGISNKSRELETPDGEIFRRTSNEIHTGVEVPLFFTPGVQKQNINLSMNYSWGINKDRPEAEGMDDFRYNYLSHRLFFSNSRIKAFRQALPTWAQQFDINYAHEVTGISISQFCGSAEFVIPSVHPSHYLLLLGEYLNQEIGADFHQLSSNYAGARGFVLRDGGLNYRLGITYGFTLLYPERGFGSILYTSRIRMQPFFDMAYTDSFQAPSSNLKSAGIEFVIDFDAPGISIGLRYARLLSGYEGGPDQFEFFIPSQRF